MLSFSKRFLSAVVLLASVLILAISQPAIAQTTSLLAEPTAEQMATLVGPKADAPIPIYLRPAANQPNVGYGRNGDRVSVLEEFGDFLMEGDRAATWSHIRLEDSPYTEGWVRGTSLVLEARQAE